MRNLILFTNRSGSTLFTDLISYSQGTINLGEGLHSIVRTYNYNNDIQKQSALYKAFSSNMTINYHNVKTKGWDHIGFFKAKEERMNILKNSSESWTVKENLEKQTLDLPLIDYCIDNGINIYMTHRRNIVEQFISKINARYRLEQAEFKTDPSVSKFIYTNNDPYVTYNAVKVPFAWLHMYTNVFIGQLFMWRVIYDKFKSHIKLVSYEDNIKPLQLSQFGITQEQVSRYMSEKTHLVPTPFNTPNVIVTDDLPPSIAGAWDQCLYLVERHKYLVEI